MDEITHKEAERLLAKIRETDSERYRQIVLLRRRGATLIEAISYTRQPDARQKYIMEHSLDIRGGDVEVRTSHDNKVLWVNIDGLCALRVCAIEHLFVELGGPKK